MGSCCRNKIFDPVRGCWVAATPEEIVRQALIKKMVLELGFPQALLAVEKRLQELPHLQQSTEQLPKRRADLLCFAQGIHPHYPLYPLLLIECKAKRIDRSARAQLAGYNYHMRAFFIGIASEDSFLFTSIDNKIELSFLPSYQELIKVLDGKTNFC